MKRFKRTPDLLTLLLAGIGLSAVHGSPPDSSQAGDTSSRAPKGVVVERDEANQTVRIAIPARGGKLAWQDVIRAMARAGGLEDTALRRVLPSGQLDLTARRSRYSLIALNVVLAPAIRLSVVPAATGGDEPYLLVLLDRQALQDKKRGFKARVRRVVSKLDRQSGSAHQGLQLEPGWKELGPHEQLVIVVHGYQSSAQGVGSVVSALRLDGFHCGTFAYPNDQVVADSGRALGTALRQIAVANPERPIALVTHSMGGLVARAMVEDPQLDPGNVRKLIMIAPPTHGSQLAHLSLGADVWEHLLQPSDRKGVKRLFAAVEDGLAEAAADLRPDSPFLKTLNARSRNPRVRYTILLGTGGPLTETQLEAARVALARAARRSKTVQLFSPRIDAVLADLDEVVRGKGDGVVAVKRGRLEGVADTQILDFTHRGAIQASAQSTEHELYRAVLKRLKADDS